MLTELEIVEEEQRLFVLGEHVRLAVLAERERCAKIVEDEAPFDEGHYPFTGQGAICRRIAEKIRKEG